MASLDRFYFNLMVTGLDIDCNQSDKYRDHSHDLVSSARFFPGPWAPVWIDFQIISISGFKVDRNLDSSPNYDTASLFVDFPA
jgi:hypothetical protein